MGFRQLTGLRCGGALLALLMAGNTFAATADELFAEGNRLYRDDLYWAALLRYQQASDAGLDTPLLSYNRGVAHYRAGQYARARESLLVAAEHPGMSLLARYNLGLTAMASGERDEALRWFLDVREQELRPQLADLAATAIDDILAARLQPAAEPAEPQARSSVSLPSGLQLIAMVGVGSDDNAFRSPDQDYTDPTQPGNPTVTPLPQSGIYYPLDLTVRYSVGSFEHESFYGSYRLAGRYYQDPELKNATEASHQLAFGSEYHRRNETRERKIFSAFTIARHDETWVDRDDGSERDLDGENVGERMSYVRYGPELLARQSWSRLSFSLRGKGQIWNYDAASDLPEYDHEYLTLGVSAQYRFTTTSLLRVEANVAQRRFGDRPAYDNDGVQRIDNPAVTYEYTDYGALARQRVTRHFWFGIRYARTERRDQHVGYNDYLRDSYGAEFSLRIADRLKLKGEAWYRIYNYVRAYAYHDIASGRKTLEAADARVSLRWQISERLGLVGRYDYRDTASNDLRIDYTRSQFMLGLEWQQ